jgi:hybrid cluster-associated redox disulfide protein
LRWRKDKKQPGRYPCIKGNEVRPFLNTCLIAPELLVDDLLKHHPQTIPVFLKYHLHCVGCCMARFDTLQEVSDNYQLQWLTFQNDLKQALQNA